MHVSRRELLDDFLAFVGEAADADARDLAERLLNRTLTTIWLKHPWAAYRSPVPFELTLVPNQIRYALPDYYGRMEGVVRNLTCGGAVVAPRQPGGVVAAHPLSGTSLETPGRPQDYEIAGVCGVHTQPASAGDALEVLSDNAADLDVVVAIAGDDGSGHWTRNQVTLTGTAPVAIGTWSFVDECAKAYLASATPVTELTSSRGTVTLRKVSDQTELQRLFAQESALEHQIFAVYPKPAAADVLALPILRRPKRLFNDADAIPDLWEPAIFEGMRIEWSVNTGEIPPSQAGSVPRPALLDLVAFDNECRRANGASRTQPFGGLR